MKDDDNDNDGDDDDDNDNAQDDCDQDAVANMDDICPCDPTKSVTDLHGLVPHEVCMKMTMMTITMLIFVHTIQPNP